MNSAGAAHRSDKQTEGGTGEHTTMRPNHYAVEAQQINRLYAAKQAGLPHEVTESLLESSRSSPGWLQKLFSFRSCLWSRKALTMKWITRERVKVDRVACPWLIKKFVDPQAEFLFVPADQVLDTAQREGA